MLISTANFNFKMYVHSANSIKGIIHTKTCTYVKSTEHLIIPLSVPYKPI